MQAPTAADLLYELLVQQALEQAWNDSLPGDSVQRHEEGGWIYMDFSVYHASSAPMTAFMQRDLLRAGAG